MATIERAIPAGGASLNFAVVGGTAEPTNPKENTIWVNTETAIGEWQFSAVEPTARADGSALVAGDAWIKTSDAGVAGFNVLKKNSIEVYPNACCQWDGTSFIAKTARIYQNNEWRSWDLRLTEAMWLDVTEAFYQSGQSFTKKEVVYDEDTNTLQCTLQRPVGSWVGWYRHHNTKISTGNFTRITVELVTPSGYAWYLYVCSARANINSAISQLGNKGTGTYELEIPKNTDIYLSEYYAIGSDAANAATPVTVKLTFKA